MNREYKIKTPTKTAGSTAKKTTGRTIAKKTKIHEMKEEDENQEGIENPKPTKYQKQFLEIANKMAKTTKEIGEIQKQYKKKGLQKSEQSWVDTNFTPIVDLMGENVIWEFMVPNIELRTENKHATTRKIQKTEHPVAVYSAGHWRSRKAGEDKFFDPYDEYQILGTNQFCQTYSLMHLLDKLPEPIPSEPNDISKYYHYTKCAIEFIMDVFTKFDFVGETKEEKEYNRNYHVNRAKNCLKNSNTCLNVIEVDNNVL